MVFRNLFVPSSDNSFLPRRLFDFGYWVIEDILLIQDQRREILLSVFDWHRPSTYHHCFHLNIISHTSGTWGRATFFSLKMGSDLNISNLQSVSNIVILSYRHWFSFILICSHQAIWHLGWQQENVTEHSLSVRVFKRAGYLLNTLQPYTLHLKAPYSQQGCPVNLLSLEYCLTLQTQLTLQTFPRAQECPRQPPGEIGSSSNLTLLSLSVSGRDTKEGSILLPPWIFPSPPLFS